MLIKQTGLLCYFCSFVIVWLIWNFKHEYTVIIHLSCWNWFKVELIGYASGDDHLYLVYEFVQNGSLNDHLHDPLLKGIM